MRRISLRLGARSERKFAGTVESAGEAGPPRPRWAFAAGAIMRETRNSGATIALIETGIGLVGE
jgi:hypothetical protein